MKKMIAALTMFCVMSVSACAENILTISVRTIMKPKQTVQLELTRYGDRAYQADSLIVSGTLMPEDFPAMSKLCQLGRLKGIDLSNCNVYGSIIPSYAFNPEKANETDGEFRSQLEYITLPRNISTFGDRAFSMTNIKTIVLPRRLENIGDNVFDGCDSLKSVTVRQLVPTEKLGRELNSLPETAVVYIPQGSLPAYKECDGWKTVKHVLEADEAFRIRTVNVGEEGLQAAWGKDCYHTDSLIVTGTLKASDFVLLKKNVQVGALTGIDFSGCALENNIIPARAFLGMDNLFYVTIPDYVESIRSMTFQGSGLRQIVLPSSLKLVVSEAFFDCTHIAGDLRIPEGTEKLGYSCFYACYQLKNIYLPSTLNEVTEDALNFSLPQEGKKPVCNLYVNRMTPPDYLKYSEEEDSEYCTLFSDNTYEEWTLSGWKLYVPVGAKKNFENARYWKDIPEIIETPELTGGVTAVKPIHAVDDKGLTEVYTLGGRLVSKGRDLPRGLAKGLYVVKTDGKTQKMLINE